MDQGVLTNIARREIVLPGITRPYTIIAINDMHVIVNNEEIKEEEKETVLARQGLFSNSNQMMSPEIFERIMAVLDQTHADRVVFLGDIIDFYSLENARLVGQAIDALETPNLRISADHDIVPFYSNVPQEDVDKLHQDLADHPVKVLEYEDFTLLGIENSTSPLSETGWEQAKAVLEADKPVIVLTHVPYNSTLGDDMERFSESVKNGRKLIWGIDCYYYPQEMMLNFLNGVYAPKTRVEAVLSGHLHAEYETMLTEQVVQYVLPPSYLGSVTIIEIKPE
jgi:predicted MPP superfamily phosphohydrolase